MNKIRCMIVDDEPLALDVLETFVERLDNLELVCRCNNAVEAYNCLQNEHIDLMFLDINMPELSGLDLLKSLRDAPLVIFTTAYPQFALESYELDAIDSRINQVVEESVKFAEESPYPEASEIYKDIYTEENYPYITD